MGTEAAPSYGIISRPSAVEWFPLCPLCSVASPMVGQAATLRICVHLRLHFLTGLQDNKPLKLCSSVKSVAVVISVNFVLIRGKLGKFLALGVELLPSLF